MDQFTCGTTGSFDSLSTQLWGVAHEPSNGVEYLIPWSNLRYSGIQLLCLDVAWGSTDDGTMLEQWPCNHGGNQQFAFFDAQGHGQDISSS